MIMYIYYNYIFQQITSIQPNKVKLHTSVNYHNYLIPSGTKGEIISNGTDYIRWEIESNYYIFHDIFTTIMEYRTSNIISEENKEIINNMLMFLYSYIQLNPVYL